MDAVRPVFVVTGPSGAGKGTLIQAILERVPELAVAISATTRPQRPGEEDGREYWFLSDEEFTARVEDDGFLEWVEYVSHRRYGTLRAEIDRIAAVAEELGVVAPVMVRVTVGVEAHTHEFIATGHEDQKFGFSLTGGLALEAARRVLARPDVFDLRGLHSHIGSQIFHTSGFETPAAPAPRSTSGIRGG